MTISLNPELQQFLQSQVDAGNFPTVQAAIEASVRLMQEMDATTLSEETLDAIDEAERQIERGEVYTADEVKRMLSEKLGVRFT